MFIDNGKYLRLVEFEKMGIEAIYTHRGLGNVQDLHVRKQLLQDFDEKERIFISGRQTHSINIVDLKDTDKIYFEDVDGYITKRKDVMIFTQYADCLPIYFYDKVNEVIGICHSGWKGSYDGIGIKLIELMKENYGTQNKDLIIAFGVGISQKNYEVSEEFYTNFVNKYSEDILQRSFSKYLGKYFFDNQEFNYNLFLEFGIPRENIIKNELCTYRENKFYSYRREKDGAGRNGGYIFFK